MGLPASPSSPPPQRGLTPLSKTSPPRREAATPTYAFECENHGRFTSVHPITAIPELQPCPKCGADSHRGFIVPEGFIGAWIPPFQHPGEMSTRHHPQYGLTNSKSELRGKEQKELERVNSRQTSERWELRTSVCD